MRKNEGASSLQRSNLLVFGFSFVAGDEINWASSLFSSLPLSKKLHFLASWLSTKKGEGLGWLRRRRKWFSTEKNSLKTERIAWTFFNVSREDDKTCNMLTWLHPTLIISLQNRKIKVFKTLFIVRIPYIFWICICLCWARQAKLSLPECAHICLTKFVFAEEGGA